MQNTQQPALLTISTASNRHRWRSIWFPSATALSAAGSTANGLASPPAVAVSKNRQTSALEDWCASAHCLPLVLLLAVLGPSCDDFPSNLQNCATAWPWNDQKPDKRSSKTQYLMEFRNPLSDFELKLAQAVYYDSVSQVCWVCPIDYLVQIKISVPLLFIPKREQRTLINWYSRH